MSQVKVKNEDATFALKRIKKAHVVENKQEEHIHSERRILTEVNSPFIIKWVLSSSDIISFLSGSSCPMASCCTPRITYLVSL